MRAVQVLAACATVCAVALGGGIAHAQSLTVVPVNLNLAPGDQTTTLSVTNQGAAETSIQVRVLAWSQPGGEELLVPSTEVMASPPIATIAPGATQVVRLVLRKAPQGQEATYRILLDQIPPVAAPGTVRIALRLSIPVFAQPQARAVAQVQYRVESEGGKTYLVALNNGARHETIRDIALASASGAPLKLAANASPYILAGAMRRWLVATPPGAPAPGGSLRLTGKGDGGPIDQTLSVSARP